MIHSKLAEADADPFVNRSERKASLEQRGAAKKMPAVPTKKVGGRAWRAGAARAAAACAACATCACAAWRDR